MMPNPELLAGLVDETTGDTLEDETSRENATKTAVTVRASSLVPTGQGLPALPKKLVDRILSNEYIDFSELPPAKGKCGLYTRAWKTKLSLYKRRTSSSQGS